MAEGARLESVYAGNRIEGSNPSPSANQSPANRPNSPQFLISRIRFLSSKAYEGVCINWLGETVRLGRFSG